MGRTFQAGENQQNLSSLSLTPSPSKPDHHILENHRGKQQKNKQENLLGHNKAPQKIFPSRLFQAKEGGEILKGGSR